MKAYHYLLILAVIIGGWYFYNWKKEPKSKKEDKNTNENKTPAENTGTAPIVRSIDLEKATEVVDNAETCYVYRQLKKYFLNADGQKYFIDKDTYAALVEAGIEDKGIIKVTPHR